MLHLGHPRILQMLEKVADINDIVTELRGGIIGESLESETHKMLIGLYESKKEHLLRDIDYLIEEVGVIDIGIDQTPAAKDFMMKTYGKEIVPNLEKHYTALRKNLHKYNIGLARIEMPVIDAEDVGDIQGRLDSGDLDVFKPFYSGRPLQVGDLPQPQLWLTLGQHDGSTKDDKVAASIREVSAKDLKPVQRQIWFDKVLNNISKHGLPTEGSRPTRLVSVVSKDGYIIDGHHRWAAAYLSDPKIKLKCLVVDLPVKKLLEITNNWTDAMGRERNP